MIDALIACILSVLIASTVAFKLLYAQTTPEQRASATWLQWVGTGLSAFMLGAFWPLTGGVALGKWIYGKLKK